MVVDADATWVDYPVTTTTSEGDMAWKMEFTNGAEIRAERGLGGSGGAKEGGGGVGGAGDPGLYGLVAFRTRRRVWAAADDSQL